MGFAGKNAFVTGAGSGMGLAIANGLLAEGCHVTLFDVKPKPEGIARGPGEAHYAQGDLADESAVAKAVSAAFERKKRLDYLVNAAGVLLFDQDKSLVEMDLSVWDKVMAVNLKSMVHTCRHAVPLMKRTGGGAMVHISSIQCLRGDDKPQDAYQASKAAMVALSKSLAIQFAADKIRSNVIYPGPTLTPMQQRWYDDPAKGETVAKFVPLGRLGTAEDIAHAALFLLSDKASFVTGTELVVDGGVLARP